MNATLVNVSVRPWSSDGLCDHDTFEVWETYEASGGALNVTCTVCGVKASISPTDGLIVTMTRGQDNYDSLEFPTYYDTQGNEHAEF